MSSIEESVCVKILARADVGEKKYGVTMDKANLNLLDWLEHSQQELMDACIYLEKIMQNMKQDRDESIPF